MASPTFFVGGSTPNSNDGTWIVLMKILGATIDGGGGSGGGAIPPGVVDPNGNVTGSPGDMYWNTANSSLWVKDSGTGTNTGWEQVI
jgi:hypothetical protein